MYMNGRGPMTGGNRGPMGGPTHHRSMFYSPGMGFRPMRVHRRPMGFFPIGGLFLLPALMFGGWMAVALLAGVLSIAGCIIGEVFEGLSSIASGAFSGSGLLIGMVLGYIAFRCLRKRNAKKTEETASTVDGVEVETEIVEPVHYSRMGGQ